MAFECFVISVYNNLLLLHCIACNWLEVHDNGHFWVPRSVRVGVFEWFSFVQLPNVVLAADDSIIYRRVSSTVDCASLQKDIHVDNRMYVIGLWIHNI